MACFSSISVRRQYILGLATQETTQRAAARGRMGCRQYILGLATQETANLQPFDYQRPTVHFARPKTAGPTLSLTEINRCCLLEHILAAFSADSPKKRSIDLSKPC